MDARRLKLRDELQQKEVTYVEFRMKSLLVRYPEPGGRFILA